MKMAIQVTRVAWWQRSPDASSHSRQSRLPRLLWLPGRCLSLKGGVALLQSPFDLLTLLFG